MDERERFTCVDVFHRLQLLVDREGEAEPARLAARHLCECEACRDEHRFEEAVQGAIRARLSSARAPAALRTRVLALVAAAGSSHGPSSEDWR